MTSDGERTFEKIVLTSAVALIGGALTAIAGFSAWLHTVTRSGYGPQCVADEDLFCVDRLWPLWLLFGAGLIAIAVSLWFIWRHPGTLHKD